MQLRGHFLFSASAVLLVSIARPSVAQVVDVDARAMVLYEPSSTSELLVIHPGGLVTGHVTDAVDVFAGYDADIVTGATEPIKAGPLSGVDVVSGATDFNDTRNVFQGGFSVERKVTRLSAAYAYGTEHDYRSQSFSVSAGADFFQKNTQIDLSYARGFDEVCTTDYAETTPTTARQALDSSEGCFDSSAENRATRPVELDNYQVAWSQSWTPIFTTQAILTGQLQNGFLENPYRSVVIAPSGEFALENQPDNRARGALSLRGKYFIRSWNSALTVSVRGYHDTWDMWAGTYEVSLEKHWTSWLRLLGRARFHQQTGVIFWSDDYTGGEPENGPRGQYWSGDRELSPLNGYSGGVRAIATAQGHAGDRLLGIFLNGSAGLSCDVLKTQLLDFTWGGVAPDDTWTGMLTLTLSGSL